MTVTTDAETIVRRAYHAAEGNVMDVQGFIDLFADDGVFNAVGQQSFRGEHLGDPVVFMGKLAPDVHRELHRVNVMGSVVAIELSIRGTVTGPFETPAGVIRGNGAKLDIPCADFWYVEEGKIKQFDCYVSSSIMLEQIGIRPDYASAIKAQTVGQEATAKSRRWISRILRRTAMQGAATNHMPTDYVVIHPLAPEDGAITAAIRSAASSAKGAPAGPEARAQFDAFMESVVPRDDVAIETETLGGIPGLWVKPASARSGEAILHLHGGWFNFGSAKAYRHLVGHIAARAGAKAFIPDYRLAPEHLFPAATDDVLACYQGLAAWGVHRIVLTGDSAGGNLALGLASRIAGASNSVPLVGVAVLSPVTDLTLSGATYETRANADPFFTHPQVAALVRSYLGSADPNDPLASPLVAKVAGMPPVRIHVGDDEVLLDDSRRYVERAVAAGVDARLDVWMGMPHGFPASVGKLKAAGQSLDAVGAFLTQRLQGKLGR